MLLPGLGGTVQTPRRHYLSAKSGNRWQSLSGVFLTRTRPGGRPQIPGVLIEHRAGAVLPTPAELLPTDDERMVVDAEIVDRLDFSAIPHLADPLVRVLPASPSFFPVGDLRDILGRLMARVAKSARQTLAVVADDQAGPLIGRLSPHDRPILILDEHHAETLTGTERLSNWPALIAVLGQLTPARLADFQSELACLHTLRLLALHLLAQGAIVPQVFALEKQEVGLRWLPARLDPVVNELMTPVTDGLPPGLVRLQQGKQTQPLTAEAQATVLCSLFLNYFIYS